MARHPDDLHGIADFLSGAGFCINVSKSVLCPTSVLVYLGVELNLRECLVRLLPGVVRSLRAALEVCCLDCPLAWRERLAGYLSFARICLKLPLEAVNAVRDGDSNACRAVLPWIREEHALSFSDLFNWEELHERQIFADATPDQLGIVSPGCAPVSLSLPCRMPIYLAEYCAALVAVLTAEPGPLTVFTDNIGVFYNLHKGRCPRSWLPLLCELFAVREFSIRHIASKMNPADAASRALLPVP